MNLWKAMILQRDLKRLESKNQNERFEAALNLRRSPDRRAVISLIQALSDADEVIRSIAVETLGLIADSRATEPLVSALDDTWEVKCKAVIALGKIRDSRAIQPLVHLLKKEPSLRELVIQSLTNLGWLPDTPELRGLDAVARRQFKQAASEGRASLRPLIDRFAIAKRVLNDLRAGNENRDRERQLLDKISEALREVGPTALDQILDLAVDSNYWAHYEAVDVLGMVGDDRVVRTLGDMLLRSRDSKLHGRCVEALKRIRHPDAVPYLLHVTKTADYFLAKDAIGAMTSIGQISADSLWSIVESKELNPNLRSDAIDALGDIAAEASIDNLITILSQWKENYFPNHAAKALGKIGSKRAVEPLIAALTSSSYELPIAAAEALGELRNPRSLAPLVAYAKSLKREKDAHVAINSITKILEHCATSAKQEELQLIAAMADILWEEKDWSDSLGQWVTRAKGVSCSSVRRLAEQELVRRIGERAR